MNGEEWSSIERNEIATTMGFWTLLCQAVGVLCFIGQVIMTLERHWEFMEFLRQKLWPLLRKNKEVVVPVVIGLFGGGALLAAAYHLATSGFFAWVAGLHRHLSSTIAVPLLMAVFYMGLDLFLESQTKFGNTITSLPHPSKGWTKENQFSTGLFALMVFMDLSSGPLVAIGVSLLVVFFCYMEFESYSNLQKDWTPQVNASKFLDMMFVYNLYSALFGLLVAILSYWELSSASCVLVVTALLLVSSYRNCGRLGSLNIFRAAVISSFIFVVWKLLVALVVAIHLYTWLSSETLFKLVLASLMVADRLGLPSVDAMIEGVSNLLERI